MRKAQTATEYLIILAVVIFIALIVVGVMGGIPGLQKIQPTPQDQCKATNGTTLYTQNNVGFNFYRCECPANTTFNNTLGCIKV